MRVKNEIATHGNGKTRVLPSLPTVLEGEKIFAGFSENDNRVRSFKSTHDQRHACALFVRGDAAGCLLCAIKR